MPRFPWLALLLLLAPLPGCLEAEFALRADGSVTGTVAWDAVPEATAATVRTVLTANDVTIKRIDLTEIERAPTSTTPAHKVRRVVAEVEAPNPTALAAMPLFKKLGVSISLGEAVEGKRTLGVIATHDRKSPMPPEPSDNVVRLRLPGPVVATSADATGGNLTWTFSMADYMTKPSVELSVVFATGTTAPPAS